MVMVMFFKTLQELDYLKDDTERHSLTMSFKRAIRAANHYLSKGLGYFALDELTDACGFHDKAEKFNTRTTGKKIDVELWSSRLDVGFDAHHDYLWSKPDYRPIGVPAVGLF